MEPERPALVLGSSQDRSLVDADACERAGVAVVQRRSGGGAVLVLPGEAVWIDLVLPATDPRWDADVGRASWWVGEAWAAAVACAGGPTDLAVHRGPMVRTDWSALACFAGVGPGEVLHPDGRKVVGLSQRRTRTVARFQGSLHLHHEGAALAGLLALPSASRAALADVLDAAVAAVAVDAAALVDALAATVATPPPVSAPAPG
jgi:lipoate---protein ligase